jgi:5-methyltetrahydrofolate--homocysteine methyltransferase
MPDITLRFMRDTVVVDGAMGSLLLNEGIDPGFCPMLLNVLEPEMLLDIHKRYLLAGAGAITTNSFGGSRPALAAHRLEGRAEELNRTAVALAKAVRPEHVLANIGPSGLLMAPFGKASFEEAFEAYAEQARFLASEGPDAILIETMTDIADARCALMAAKSACDLPVFVSLSFTAAGHMQLSGTDPATAAVILKAAGADVVGMNCGMGPAEYLPLLRQMAEASDLPLIIQPNAGPPRALADGSIAYDGSPDLFAEAAWAYRQLGAQFIGSCCGTTPTFTAAIYAAVGGTDVIGRSGGGAEGGGGRAPRLRLASPSGLVDVTADGPCRVIGERINPTGKPDLAASLALGDTSIAATLAIEQAQAGAELIDVNVFGKDLDAKLALPALVAELSGLTRAPLVLDCLNTKAIEAALRIYPGRALINAVNASPSRMQRLLPMARQYGAAIIALCTDGNTLPEGIDGLLEVAERIRDEAHAAGLCDDDILFDALAMAQAFDEDAIEKAALAVRAFTERGWLTVLAISNISYKHADKSGLNAQFVSAVVEAGLSAAILNPNDPQVMAALVEANATRAARQAEAGLASTADA